MKNKLLYLILAVILIIVIIIVAIIMNYNNNNKDESNINNISERQEGGEEYNSKQLDNFNFNLVNMNSDVRKNIKDFSKFTYSMKEFLYKNGNVECNQAEFLAYDLKDNIMTIKFKLNNKEESRVIAKINLQKDTYDFMVY